MRDTSAHDQPIVLTLTESHPLHRSRLRASGRWPVTARARVPRREAGRRLEALSSMYMPLRISFPVHSARSGMAGNRRELGEAGGSTCVRAGAGGRGAFSL